MNQFFTNPQLRKQTALVLIAFGAFILFTSVFNMQVWPVLIPLIFLFVGLWLLYEGSFPYKEIKTTRLIFGRIERTNQNITHSEYLQLFSGDINLDLSEVEISDQTVVFYITAIFSNIHITVPKGYEIDLKSNAFFTAANLFDEGEEHFLRPFHHEIKEEQSSPNKMRCVIRGGIIRIRLSET
ncbi:MAG: hypothetical protein GF313_04255 [Caldithrix sp.]|nr:hypothetical protein [Caldithrix sp.]